MGMASFAALCIVVDTFIAERLLVPLVHELASSGKVLHGSICIEALSASLAMKDRTSWYRAKTDCCLPMMRQAGWTSQSQDSTLHIRGLTGQM